MFTIGEFSKISGLTVKTLRFYHEQGLLVPTCVDDQTGYRYYSAEKVETARVIAFLRELDIPVAEIAEILREAEDDADLLEFMKRQRRVVDERMQRFRKIAVSLDQFLASQQEARRVMTSAVFEVEEKVVPTLLVAGVRMRGRYADCGQGFGRIGRRHGRHICGKAMLLHYDAEYRETDADFEACLPIRQGRDGDGVSVHELPGGRCVSLVHKGPYEQLGPSYAKILAHIKSKSLQVIMPTREVYHRGPGMIFRGNPRNYLTEIQMFVREVGSEPKHAAAEDA